MTDVATMQREEREAAEQRRTERAERKAQLLEDLREAELSLKALDNLPSSSNETLNRLMGEVETASARYSASVARMVRDGRHVSLSDLRLDSVDAQCFFAPGRVREGVKRLFPEGAGITDSERLARRGVLSGHIVGLNVELNRLGGR